MTPEDYIPIYALVSLIPIVLGIFWYVNYRPIKTIRVNPKVKVVLRHDGSSYINAYWAIVIKRRAGLFWKKAYTSSSYYMSSYNSDGPKYVEQAVEEYLRREDHWEKVPQRLKELDRKIIEERFRKTDQEFARLTEGE